jgi:hypothetical protein
MSTETVDIFLCHSGADNDWVRMLATRVEQETLDGMLATRRLKVFNDERDIGAGDVFVPRMLEGVAAARYVGLVMSPEFFQSPYTSIEAAHALRTKPLIPIFLRDTPIRQGENLTGLPFVFREFTYYDFRQPCDFERQFAGLIAHIRRPARNLGVDADAPKERGLLELVETTLAIARQRNSSPGRSTRSTSQAQPLVVARPFSSLEEAFTRVQSRAGLVSSSAPTRRVLGCAWVFEGKHLLCAARVADGARVAIERGSTVLLSPLQMPATPWVTPIYTVSQSGFAELAILHAHPLGRVPLAPEMIWTEVLHSPLTAEPLGAIGLRRDDETPNPVTALRRVHVREWRVPGGAPLSASQEYAEWVPVPGTPLFDRAARVIGFLMRTEVGELTAIPLSRQTY